MFLKMRTKIFRSVYTNAIDSVKSFESIPRPFQLPFVGNWHLYKLGIYNPRKYPQVLLDMYRKYGPIVYEKIGLDKPIIHVFEPDDVETVYRNEDKTPRIYPLNQFTKAFREREEMSGMLGNTNDEEWYKLKKAIRNLMFKSNSAQKYFKDSETVTDDLIEVIRRDRDDQGRIDDLRLLLGKWTQEVAGQILHNKRLGYLCGPNEAQARKLFEANETVFRLGTNLKFSLPFYEIFETPTWKESVECERIVHKIAVQHIEESLSKIDELVKTNTLKEDQYSFLITLLKREELTRQDVTIVGVSLSIDGLSATVPVLINNLYCLANNPEVQEKAYEEICKATGDKDQNLDVGVLNELSYLKAVIKETFRTCPLNYEIARINKKPLVLSNYYIPAESNLSLNQIVHLKSPKYFSDPDAFKPERWLRGAESSDVHPFLMAPFGHGARTCAGRRFAEQDLQISLMKILKNFKLVYPSDAPRIDFVLDTLIFPERNLPIRFIPR